MSRESRIEQERQEFIEWKNSISCDGYPQKGDSTWNVVMDGPKDSPYMGGKFQISIIPLIPTYRYYQMYIICHQLNVFL